jgi:hypothetical protein
VKADLKDKKHGSGWIVYPDGTQYKGEFIDDEPVFEDAGDSADGRYSTETRFTTDGESIESLKSDQSGKSATSSKGGKRLENTSGKSGTSPKGGKVGKRLESTSVKHEKSRLFVETVGRKIKNPD